MNTKQIIVTLTLVSASLAGCSEAPSSDSRILDESASKPVLTSTAAPASTVKPTPAREPMKEEPKPKPSIAKPASLAPEPAEEPPAPTYEPAIETIDGLTLRRFVTTSMVEEREPTEAGSVFTNEVDKIYAFIEASNESSVDKVLVVHFIGPENRVSGGIELEIPASAPRWRTWAYTRHAKTPGLWRIEVRDLDGAVVGVLPFEVEAAR